MFNKIRIKSILILCFILSTRVLIAGELINLNTEAVSNKLSQSALVIDIRTPGEWQSTGIIPGSHPVKFFDRNGKYDVEQWLATVQKLQKSPDQEIILVCRSGGRSSRVGNLLTQQLNMSNIAHLENGISSWIKERRPTESVCSATKTCE